MSRGARSTVHMPKMRSVDANQIKSFWKSQFPNKSVNLSYIITNIKDKLTDLYGK